MKAFTLLLSVLLLAGCSKPATYWCPMHPEVTSTDPNAQCDKCGGMKLLPKEADAQPTAAAPAPKGAKYFCPMHPQITADKPGDCPICNMRLVPAGQDEDAGHSEIPGLAAVKISPETRHLIGLKMGTVEKRSLRREVRTSARILADESRQYRVTTKIEGWVEKLFVNVTGQAVKQGDPLLTIYSPALVSAQEEYLAADNSLKPAVRRRLELWDISGAQIEQLEKAGKAEKFIPLAAPASGVVMEKTVLAGQKIMPGDALLVIADLRHVWADADIYQSDLPHVTVGMPVEVTIPTWPDKVFTGRVSFISPALDPSTRTVQARLEVENPDLLLKPGLFANARLAQPLGELLAIPEDAVLRTGDRTYAFKDGGEGRLMPVAIQIGVRNAGYFEVIAGLQAGDRVVTSANFLVDSESSLKAALNAMSGGHQH